MRNSIGKLSSLVKREKGGMKKGGVKSPITMMLLAMFLVIGGGLAYKALATTGISVTSPNGGEYWSGTQNITWSADDCTSDDYVDIQYTTGGAFTTIATVACSLKTYSWNTADYPDNSNYQIRIYLDGNLGINDLSDAIFTIDNTAPTFTINNGTDNSPVKTDTINVTTTDNLSGVASQEYGFSTDDTCNSSDTYGNAFTSGSDFNITGNHTDYLCVKATDNANVGNVAFQLVGQLNTDNTSPTATVAVGTSTISDTDLVQEVTVTYNEAMLATPTPTITFSAGTWSTDSGSWDTDKKVWTQNFTITDANEEATSVAVDVSGAQDLAGNAEGANATTPTFAVDTKNPTADITYNINHAVKSGNTLKITATFSEAMADSSLPKIAISGVNTLSAVDMTKTSTTVYTYDYTVGAGDGTATVALSNGTDLADNPVVTAPTSGADFIVDNTVPTAPVITSIAGDNQINNSEKSAVIVTGTAEDGSLVAATLSDGTNTTAAVSQQLASGATAYSITINGSALNDGTITPAITATDAAGNVSAPAVTPTAIKDTTAPTVVLSDHQADNIVKNGDTVNITATFTESNSIDETTAPKITIGSIVNGATMTKSSNLVWTYAWAVPTGNDGTVNVSIAATDTAGNSNEAATGKISYVIDNTAPTVALTYNPDRAVRNADTLTITATFSEAMSSAPTIAIDTAGTDLTATGMTVGSDNAVWTYDYDVPTGSDGTATVTITGTDIAGNANTTATNNTFIIDNIAPADYSVSIDQSQIYSGNETALSFTFAGAETGTAYNYSVDDTDSNTAAITGSGSITSATQQITGIDVSSLSDGTLTLTVYLTDAAGNQGSNSTATVNKDATAPTLSTVSIASDNSDTTLAKTGDTVTLTFTANEDLAATPAVTITGQSASVTGSSASWSATYTMQSGDTEGTVAFTINFDDSAGNSGTQVTAVTDTSSVTFDKTTPTITVNTLITNDSTPQLTGTINDSSATIKVTVDGSSNLSATNNGDGTWTLADNTITSALSDGTYDVAVSATDPAGNTATDSTTGELTIDTAPPTITNFTPPTADAVYKTAPLLAFTPNDSATAVSCSYSIDGGTAVSVTCTSGSAVSTTITGLADGRRSLVVTVTDAAGNSVSSSAVEFVYDNDGILTVAKTGNSDFAKIQDAIDASVAGITTIQVADGTYNENININKSLILSGANADVDPNTSSRGSEAIISSAGGTAVTISADSVTIDGFTITNNGVSSGTGIYSADYSNLTIKNNIISNIGNSSDDVYGRGMEIISSSSATANVDSVSITNNKIEGITSGLRTGSNSTSASGISIGWNAGTEDITNLSIKDNVISNINANTNPWTDTTKGQGAYGILINHGTAGGQTINAQITNNTINTLEGLWAHGIGLEGDTLNAVVTGNTISNLTDHKSPSDAVAVWAEDNPSVGTVTVHNNKFSSVNVGVALNPSTATGVLDATNNWWGDVTGPKATDNPDGLGSGVIPVMADSSSHYITYRPWCAEAGCSTTDVAAPTVALSYSANPAKAGTETITATYSEAVVDTPKISVNQQGATDITDAPMTTSDNIIWTYEYTVHSATESGYADGTASVSLSPVNDSHGNIATAPTHNTFTIDTTAPIAPTVTAPSSATIINADNYIITGTAEADSLVQIYQNSSVVASQQLSGSATDYSIPVALTQDSVNQFTVTATDSAGNESVPVTVLDITEDSTVPNIANLVPINGLFTNNNASVISADLNDSVGIDTSVTSSVVLKVDGVDVTASALITPSSPNASISYTPSPVLSDGSHTVTLDVKDLAGNSATQATTSFTVDTTLPTVAVTSPNGSEHWAGASSHNITWTASDINLATNPITLSYSTDGSTWTQIATDEANDGTYDWTVPGINSTTVRVRVTAADQAGNTASDTSDADFTIDSTAPTLTSVSIVSSNATSTLAEAGDTVTLTFTADEAIQTPTAAFTSGGSAVAGTVSVVNTSGNTWTATYTANSGDTDGAVAFTIDYSDTAGNAGAQRTSVTDSSSVLFDKTAPTLAEVTPVPTPANDATPDYTFSSDEAGTIIYSGDCSSDTTSATNSNNTITFNSLSDGTHNDCTITVTDAAGNPSSALSVTDFTVDTTLPTITNLAPINTTTSDTTPTISANFSDGTGDVSGIDTNSAVIKVDNTNVTTFATINADSLSYTPGAPMADGIHTVTVDVKDLAGNSATQASWKFEVASTIVSVDVSTDKTSLTADGSSQAKITAHILDNGIAVSGATVTFATTIGTLSDITTSDSNGRATAMLTSTDVGKTTVTASYNAPSRLVSGTVNVIFTEVILPTAVQSLTDGSTDVAVNIHPTITFSKAMDNSTLTASYIQLRKYDTTSGISTSLSISADNKTVTIIPSADLDYNTQYYFWISSTVKDSVGNSFGSSWQKNNQDDHEFTTATTPKTVCNEANTSCDISLNAGWNLISLPLIPTSTAIADVLSGISTNVDIVKYYDASTKTWSSYVPSGTGGLTTMEDGKGYWIDMTEAKTLTVNGTETPAAGPNNMPAYSVIGNKWNLIGFKSVANMSVKNYITQIGNDDVLWVYKNGEYVLVHPSGSDSMEPGYGYWLYPYGSDGYSIVPTN